MFKITFPASSIIATSTNLSWGGRKPVVSVSRKNVRMVIAVANLILGKLYHAQL